MCRKNHACVRNEVYCRPAWPIDPDNFYFIGSDHEADCPYQKKYGHLFTCGCPLRKAIFKGYKV
ncbi:hypothetical protein ACUUL3_04600 [Thiovibrio sp. JS02]